MLDVDEERQRFESHERSQRERVEELMVRREQPSERDTSYRIGPGDEIEINVFDVPELNLTTRVRESGFVTLPLIGAVRAGGVTEGDLIADLNARLAKYLRNPQVSVFINNFGSQKVAVMGAVRKPGAYSLKKGQNSLIEIISQAGGITEKAGNYLDLVPGGGSIDYSPSEDPLSAPTGAPAPNAVQIPLASVLGTNGGMPIDVPLRSGDTIVIPEAGKIVVEGEVLRTGNYQINQQMTLLGALAASGGITYAAKIDEVEIVREIGPGDKARLVLDLEKIASGQEKDVPLKSGDVIRVPTHMGRRLQHDTFEGITRLINFGVGGNVNLAN